MAGKKLDLVEKLIVGELFLGSFIAGLSSEYINPSKTPENKEIPVYERIYDKKSDRLIPKEIRLKEKNIYRADSFNGNIFKNYS